MGIGENQEDEVHLMDNQMSRNGPKRILLRRPVSVMVISFDMIYIVRQYQFTSCNKRIYESKIMCNKNGTLNTSHHVLGGVPKTNVSASQKCQRKAIFAVKLAQLWC
jgi:hypothetical protein